MKILFIDDDPSVLEGLENRFRRYRKQWQMTFLVGGEAALEVLDQESFDVVVSDIRMPDVDGITVLKTTHLNHPKTLRIALTGQTDQEQLLKSLSIAHKLVSKPCDADQLKAVIESAYELQQRITDDSVIETVNRIKELPSLPKIHNQLNQALATDDYSLRDLANIIEQDIALCSKLFQIVNSPAFGIQREITNALDAVSYLGIDSLRSIILNIEVFAHFEQVKPECSSFLKQLHKHAMLVSEITGILLEDAEDIKLANSAALLHDIGKLIIKCYLPDLLQEINAYAQSNTLSFYEAECATQKFTHCNIGAYLLTLWDLPTSLIEIVANHHHPLLGEPETFGPTSAVHVADYLINTINPVGSDAVFKAQLDDAFVQTHDLEPKLSAWIDAAREKLTAS